MVKKEKSLARMRNNPHDWQIADLEVIAERLGINVRKNKGSHVSFGHHLWIEILTIPAHRPVKSIYVKKFLTLIDMLNGENK